MPVAIQMVVDYVQELKDKQERLVLIVGRPGSGKSKIMRELGLNRGWRYVDCRELVTDELLELVPKARPKEAPHIMDRLLERERADVILLDNIQVLFTPILNLDPLELLRQLSRKHAIVAAWPGEYADGKLAYMEAGLPEPKRHAAAELKGVEIG
jgi:hypothetical protein